MLKFCVAVILSLPQIHEGVYHKPAFVNYITVTRAKQKAKIYF